MAELRRRSVDVGGLALALAGSAGDGSSSGAGWGGFQVKDAMDDDESVRYVKFCLIIPTWSLTFPVNRVLHWSYSLSVVVMSSGKQLRRNAERYVRIDTHHCQHRQLQATVRGYLILTYLSHHLSFRPTNEKIPGNRQRLIDSLDTWHFEPHKLPEDAVLACTILLFEALLRTENMVQDIGLDMGRFDFYLDD
jgi:hypothetical protein